MANRNFKPGAMAIEKGTIKLYGRVVYGAAGAIASQDCRGFSVTDDGVGEIGVLLEDEYNALYQCVATVQGATGLLYSLESVDVTSDTPGFTVTLTADPADGETVLLEITLKNSTVKY
jgi:hypothetical protein